MEEKLNYFLEDIRVRSQQEIDRLTEEAAARQAEAREEAGTQAEEEAARYRERALAQLRNVGQVQTDARRAEDRRRLLEQRQAWAEETAALAEEKVRAFTAGPEYPRRLEELLRQALDALGRDGPVTVYLRREDMPLAEGLKKRERIAELSFREGEFGLGGLIAVSAKTDRRADMSFDTALEAARDRFSELAGLALD